MGALVSAAELADLIAAGDVVVADVRWYLDGRSGRAAFEAGHIPGAVFIDLDTALAAPVGEGPGRHPLPAPAVFAAAMAAAGIGSQDRVVAYDDAGGSIAARLWWMLHVTGHDAAVLDGGLAAWTGALEAGPGRERLPATFTARPWPSGATVDAVEVNEMRGRVDAVIVDARAAERYRGDVEPVDPRAGHIPGARSMPWSANLDAETGRFLSAGELRDRYAALGTTDAAVTVAYCGSGVTACHALLALHVAGIDGVLYEGSWSDWSSEPDRPAATGPEPG